MNGKVADLNLQSQIWDFCNYCVWVPAVLKKEEQRVHLEFQKEMFFLIVHPHKHENHRLYLLKVQMYLKQQNAKH